MTVWNLWGREPAMVVAFLQASLVLLVTFGLQLSPDQTAAILGVVALGLGLLTRSRVSPAT
jgi:hypothetical protein